MNAVVRLVVCLLVAAFSWQVFPADVNADAHETILFPFAFRPRTNEVPGAFGTIWSGHVWIENRSSEILSLYTFCSPGCIGISPGEARDIVEPLGTTPEAGYLFHIPVGQARQVTFSNRIFECTLRTQPRGVDIPVVREGNFFSTAQTFLGVPSGEGVRASVRVYDPWFHFGSRRPGAMLERIVIDVLDRDQRPLGSATLVLWPQIPATAHPAVGWHKPGFAAIYDLSAIAPVGAHEFVYVRVTPQPTGAQYYAMVAVTDNATQAVSIITAQ